MCRSHFDKLFIPEVDTQLQQQIASEMGSQFEERKAELEAAGEWLGNVRLVKFSFGNTHEEVKNPKPAKSGGPNTKNSHRWCMFVSLQNPEETARYIKSVTYHLHPTFKPNKIKVTEPPFLLSRVGWGWFEVEMDLEFQESTGLGTKRLCHMLCFENKGKTQSVLLELSDDGGSQQEAMAAALAKQIDRLNLRGREDDD